MSVAIQVLCEAYRRDPEAMHFLVESRVPCNQPLADDTYVIVEHTWTKPTYWHVGMLGIINGVLLALGQSGVKPAFGEFDTEWDRLSSVGFREMDGGK